MNVRRTMLDRMMIALAVVPPAALALFCVAAAATWKTEAAKIRPILETSFSPDVINAPSPSAAAYEKQTSKEKTKAYRELVAAVDALNLKYQLMFDLLDEQINWCENLDQELPFDRYLKDYLNEAQPLLDRLADLKPSERSIWQPNEFGNPNRYGDGLRSWRSMPELLRGEFRAAVRAGDTERAINAMELFRGFAAGPTEYVSYQMLPLVLQSTTSGIWSEDDLNRIDQWIQNAPDMNQEWQDSLRAWQLAQAAWLLRGEIVDDVRQDQIAATYAPSLRLQWLEYSQQFADVSGIGTVSALKRVSKIEVEWLRQTNSELDASLQWVVFGQYHDGVGQSRSYLAKLYAKTANERRNARTAVAIAKYKLKFDAYPESLDDLAKVGLPARETLDLTGQPFSYSSDEQGCRLGNAAERFQQGQWATSFNSPEAVRSGVLRSFDLLNFGM